MGRNPLMQKPVNECVDACFGYDSAGMYSYLNSDLLGVVRIYCILQGFSLVHDNTFRKYTLEGLNRKAGKVLAKNFKEMNTEHICFTDLGLAYYSVYKDEIEDKGISWVHFCSKLENEPGYEKSLLYKIHSYNKVFGGVDSVIEKAPNSPVLSVNDLRCLCEKSFNSLELLCKEMARASNDFINSKGYAEKDDAISRYVRDSHQKYFGAATMNDKELLKLVDKVKREVNEAILVLGLIENLK